MLSFALPDSSTWGPGALPRRGPPGPFVSFDFQRFLRVFLGSRSLCAAAVSADAICSGLFAQLLNLFFNSRGRIVTPRGERPWHRMVFGRPLYPFVRGVRSMVHAGPIERPLLLIAVPVGRYNPVSNRTEKDQPILRNTERQ